MTMNSNEKQELNRDELELAREAQREYNRNWRKTHPENVRKINARYWANRAKKQAAEVET